MIDYANRGGCQIHVATSSVAGSWYSDRRAIAGADTTLAACLIHAGPGKVKPEQAAHTLKGEQFLQSSCSLECVAVACAVATGSS